MTKPPQKHAGVILVVDDNTETRLLLKTFFHNFGYEVDSAPDPAEALKCFVPILHDLVVTDNSMPGMTGAEMARIIKMRSPSTPVLMYSGDPPSSCPSVDAVIKKPTSLLLVKDEVEKLLQKSR
jgi:CheY-like chemotaxis protein